MNLLLYVRRSTLSVSHTMIFYINRLQRITETMLDTNFSGFLATERLESVIWEQRRSMAKFLLTVTVEDSPLESLMQKVQ